MSFSLIDVILILAAGQGVFLLFSLLTNKKKNPNLTTLLAILLTIAVIVLLGRLLRYRIQSGWYFYIATFVDTSIFIFGPLGFLLMQKTYLKKTSNKLNALHFAPAAIHLIYAFVMLLQPIEKITIMYQNGILMQIFLVIELAGMISMIAYLLLTVRLWSHYDQQLKYVLSYEHAIGKFTKTFLICWGAFNLLWLLQFFVRNVDIETSNTVIKQIQPYFSYINIWIAIGLSIYVLSYASLRIPEIFQIPENISKNKENIRLNVSEISLLKKRLDFFLLEEKIYLDPELTRGKLAKKVDISENNLSWLLNTIFKKTFYEYINHYRVNEVKEKIRNGEHSKMTLLAIAYDAGFKSKSTFNKVFKNETGMSPSRYAESQNVA